MSLTGFWLYRGRFSFQHSYRAGYGMIYVGRMLRCLEDLQRTRMVDIFQS